MKIHFEISAKRINFLPVIRYEEVEVTWWLNRHEIVLAWMCFELTFYWNREQE